jgi:flagellar protein FlaG
MIDTNNIVAVKPIPIMQEVPAAVNSEKISSEAKSQSNVANEQNLYERVVKKSSSTDQKFSQELVGQLNNELKIFNTRIAFSIDEKTKKTVVKIIDENKNEVIRQVPPDYLLKISERISELLGILVDEKA